MADIIQQLKEKITGKGLKIVFPESNDERIVKAAVRLKKEGLIEPILVQTKAPVANVEGVSECEIINPTCNSLIATPDS